MSSKTDLKINFHFNECPFFQSCKLPKIQILYNIPSCKNCPDYTSKLEKII